MGYVYVLQISHSGMETNAYNVTYPIITILSKLSVSHARITNITMAKHAKVSHALAHIHLIYRIGSVCAHGIIHYRCKASVLHAPIKKYIIIRLKCASHAHKTQKLAQISHGVYASTLCKYSRLPISDVNALTICQSIPNNAHVSHVLNKITMITKTSDVRNACPSQICLKTHKLTNASAHFSCPYSLVSSASIVEITIAIMIEYYNSVDSALQPW